MFILIFLKRCEKVAHQSNITAYELIDMFKQIQLNYADEFLIFNLSQMIIPMLTPLLKKKMSVWRPFEVDNADQDMDKSGSLVYMYDTYVDLKNMLKDHTTTSKGEMNAFNRLLWETWMPAFRQLVSQISVKTYSIECVDIINKWYPLLPTWLGLRPLLADWLQLGFFMLTTPPSQEATLRGPWASSEAGQPETRGHSPKPGRHRSTSSGWPLPRKARSGHLPEPEPAL